MRKYRNIDNSQGKPRILSVTIHREIDDSPDLSFLGEYHSDERDDSIDRKERGDMSRNEYRYWTPAMTGEETGNPRSPEEDYERHESYNRGCWCMTGVWAEATVVLEGSVTQQIRSGGLWSIESDSGDDYFDEVEQEQLAELGEQLEAVGFEPGYVSEQLEKAGRTTQCA